MTTINVLAHYALVMVLATATIMLGLFAYDTGRRTWLAGAIATGFTCLYCAFASLSFFADIIRQ